MPAKRTLRGLSLTLVTLAAVAGCGAADPEIASPVTTEPAEGAGAGTGTGLGTDAQAPSPGGGGDHVATLASDDGTELVAEANGPTLAVWASPSESPAPERTLAAADEASGAIVLLVKQELGATWIEVYLPTAPTGATGWVRRDDVTLSQHGFRIEVDRSAHRLTVYEAGAPALETPVGIGAVDAPAAADGLFVKDLVETPQPDGPYGRYAYGLSGSSNRAELFEAGTGVVAIHGTNDPGLLGQDITTGSLAVGAEALERMVGDIGVPLGTPVTFVD